jgi:hypothetical protein
MSCFRKSLKNMAGFLTFMNAGCCGTECFCYFAGWWEGHSHGRKSSLRLGRILIYKVLEFIHQFSPILWPLPSPFRISARMQ